MEGNLNRLKNNARGCLQSLARIQNSKPRFVTYSINTVLLDLIQCIENSTQKREKRYRRMEFLYEICTRKQNIQCNITAYAMQKIQEIITLKPHIPPQLSVMEKLWSMAGYNISEDITIESSLYALEVENDMDLEDEDTLSFAKIHKEAFFLPPEKQEFDNHCKNILNENGDVYDIFTYVAIIMFYKLITDKDNPNNGYTDLHKKILDSCYLVFKGGAAIGKHLIQNNPNIYRYMSDGEKTYLFNDFIKGGDNDTSININKEELRSFYRDDEEFIQVITDTEINNAIGDIMLKLPKYMNEVLSEYNIKELINRYITAINNSYFKYRDKDFCFINRISKSYAIVDDENDDTLLQKKNYDFDRNQLYNTMSYVEFKNNNQKLTKFYLARIKCAMESKRDYGLNKINDKLKINCYAECLDVSFPCIDSTELIEEISYQNITADHMLFT
jgi:hypothetical protein